MESRPARRPGEKGYKFMRRMSALTVLSAVIALSTACATRVPRQRTLPEWINTLYVPLFSNESFEPGLEEIGTQAAVEEFLADGRLKIGSRQDADMILRVTIDSYSTSPSSFESDQFPSSSMIWITARVALFEPSDSLKPFKDLGLVQSRYTYTSDFRSVFYTIDVDAREAAMQQLGVEIVNRVITGFSEENRREIYGTGGGARGMRSLQSRSTLRAP